MEKAKISVFIVSLPGVSQRMLEQTFCYREDVDFVGIADGGLSALKKMKLLQPQVVLIDSNLPENETAALIQEIGSIDIGPVTIILVENSHQLTRATKADPDYVLRSYELTSRLNALLHEVGTRLNGKT